MDFDLPSCRSRYLAETVDRCYCHCLGEMVGARNGVRVIWSGQGLTPTAALCAAVVSLRPSAEQPIYLKACRLTLLLACLAEQL